MSWPRAGICTWHEEGVHASGQLAAQGRCQGGEKGIFMAGVRGVGCGETEVG